jgi:phosphotransferase system enzyme I (PtsI)
MKSFEGIAASSGIAIGPAFHFHRGDLHFERHTVTDPAAEWARLAAALEAAQRQIAEISARAKAESGKEEADIFEAHALMLEDPDLLETMQQAIKGQSLNAEAALQDAAENYAQILETLDNEYFSARAADVRDVASRVLRILLGVAESPTAGLTTPSIILAHDLTPSDTVLLDKSLVLGFCTVEGGATSHTAILARSLGLPAVVGAEPEVLEIPPGATLALDGGEGTLTLEPDEALIADYRTQQQAGAQLLAQARKDAHAPAITRDGHRVEVVANIGNIAGAAAALEAGAEGVGLLRTEFLYLEHTHLPDEEEQYQAYRAIIEAFGSRPVILRTLDIGGDKELRAALRASVGGNLKIMFPMVATVAEVRAARTILEECRAELLAEGQPVAENIEIGIMVEIPAAALLAERFATEVDFFSIGTNDLSQYTLAADRTNALVAALGSGFQPAVLHLVRNVITAAHAEGKWVGLCGELAGDPLAIPILLGLGLDEFSMNPPAIPLAKQIIRALTLAEAREVAQHALELDNPQTIEKLGVLGVLGVLCGLNLVWFWLVQVSVLTIKSWHKEQEFQRRRSMGRQCP